MNPHLGMRAAAFETRVSPDQYVSQTAVCDTPSRAPPGARRRVSYSVSDSLSCKRRARGPVPCAELAALGEPFERAPDARRAPTARPAETLVPDGRLWQAHVVAVQKKAPPDSCRAGH